jgi:hypothetical protein
LNLPTPSRPSSNRKERKIDRLQPQMMGASPRRPGSSGGAGGGERSGGATISIRAPRPGSFSPSRRPVLLRLSPRLAVFALIATICGLWTLLSPQTSFFSSSIHAIPSHLPPTIPENASPQRSLPEMVLHDVPPLGQRPERDQKKSLPNIKGQHIAPLAHVGPAAAAPEASRPINTKKPNPFETYLCAGDEWQVDEDNVYTKPFRFHVYQNMPDHLLKDVVERAAHWWQPDNA